MKNYLLIPCFILFTISSCISTRNTIRNIDDTAIMPALSKEKTFIITEISTDKKYGYDQDFPINLGFMPIQTVEINVKRYFGALFPSRKNEMGAGVLDIYEVKWEGLTEPKRIYINLYEKGKILSPKGFGIRVIK
jgi:hypothetical protein